MKIINSKEVSNLIKDEAVVMVGGFAGTGVAEEILISIQENYLKNKSPRDLKVVFCAGQGDGKQRGINHLGEEGLVSKVVGGHFALSPRLMDLILDNKMQGYNLPQGVISHLIRASAAKVPYIVTRVGLNTFVDPRIEGGVLNDISPNDVVEVVVEDGEELLKYKTFKPDVAILRGSYADSKGNISFEKESLILDSLSMAQATKNNGGIVIVQVLGITDEVIDPKSVIIPGILTDYVVVCEDIKNHMQTYAEIYNEAFIKGSKNTVLLEPVELNDRKIIARRAAMELKSTDRVLNYGIGIPEVIANVLNEEGLEDNVVPTVEPGVIGGTPQGGLNFGASIFPTMILDQASQFDFYDGNGIDVAFLGLAQADEAANINVSRFGPKIVGCGGFINITQNAKRVVFCGTFMAGAKVVVEDAKLVIKKEGFANKFVKQVEQITFSSQFAIDKDLPVIYITERAVFDIDRQTHRLRLIEIAPGMDLEKDIIANMGFRPEISDDLKLMDEVIFKDEKMNLKIK